MNERPAPKAFPPLPITGQVEYFALADALALSVLVQQELALHCSPEDRASYLEDAAGTEAIFHRLVPASARAAVVESAERLLDDLRDGLAPAP